MRRIHLALCLTAALLAVAPATSRAAVIIHGEGVGLVYLAAPGEVNHLTVDPFAGPIDGVSIYSMFVKDDNAPLTQWNPRCLPGPPLQCPTTTMYAYMGDGDDYGEAAPYFRDAYIWGQAGDDELVASGRDHAVAYGGSGDDTLRAGADGDAVAWGQAGNDVISASTQGSMHLYGGDGDDAIGSTSATYSASVLDGGRGRDHIKVTQQGAGLDVRGQDGADVITVAAAHSIDGGTGDDTITGHGNVEGNRGDDDIDVSGNPDQSDSVSCGPGDDTVTADPSDVIDSDCEEIPTGAALER